MLGNDSIATASHLWMEKLRGYSMTSPSSLHPKVYKAKKLGGFGVEPPFLDQY